jgi:K+-sensing histidine kinase KdpD
MRQNVRYRNILSTWPHTRQIRPRFFTKFATAGKRRGTGLGAYGARIMAEALGCAIAFTTSEEEGTEVVVKLPGATAAA